MNVEGETAIIRGFSGMPTEEIVISYRQGCFGLGAMFVGITGKCEENYFNEKR